MQYSTNRYDDDYRTRRRISERRRRRRRQVMIRRVVVACAGLLVLTLIVGGVALAIKNGLIGGNESSQHTRGNSVANVSLEDPNNEQETIKETEPAPRTPEQQIADLIEKADRLSAMYDNPAAIELIQSYPGYADIPQLTEAIAKYEATQATYVRYSSLRTIPHIFYHSLIPDNSKAFDGDGNSNGYNLVMTTIGEFMKIMEIMYNNGYVFISLHDMGHIEVREDGTEEMVPGDSWLPEGKKPLVVSQDDLSYYHYMTGDGFPNRIVLDENGLPTCEMIADDGTVYYGDYDMVPLMDRFVEEHPDASYRGAKGCIALTGYNGILGYRTDSVYKNYSECDPYQQAWLDAHPDFDWDKEREEAMKVVEGMKADGWDFASHSYGHLNYSWPEKGTGGISFESLQRDALLWENEVEPLLGDTDIMIFAFGEDIASWHADDYDNSERYHFLKSLGFDYYCNVDSNPYWVVYGDDYLRQGRRNLDGQRMWEAISSATDPDRKDRLSDLFDANEVFDWSRPTPVY